ncbi:MAG: SRPBCC family protein [Roseimicrobium sp.]
MENIVVTTVVHRPVEEVFEAITRIEEWAHLFQPAIFEVHGGPDAGTMKARICLTGRVREFEAKLVRYDPNSYIGWRSTRGHFVAGEVIFEGLSAGWTHLIVVFHYNAEGFVENALTFTKVVLHRVDAAVERLKRHLESLPMLSTAEA